MWSAAGKVVAWVVVVVVVVDFHGMGKEEI
jgi:hypothetical protein